MRALGAAAGLEERAPERYAEALRRELADARVPPKLFRDDPRGGKTFDAQAAQGDSSGCLTTVLLYLLMAAGCSGLQWCGVINTRPSRAPLDSPPRMTFTPPPVNLNLNLNYNVPPLNLRLYRAEPPSVVTPRDKRRTKRRRRAPAGANLVAPENSTTLAPANRGARPRE